MKRPNIPWIIQKDAMVAVQSILRWSGEANKAQR